MKLEYLLFNTIILGLPFMAHLFYRETLLGVSRELFLSVFVTSALFILHDHQVTNHWWSFNEKHLIGLKILKLPVEEVLFFPVVIFSSLVIWLNLRKIIPQEISFSWLNFLIFGFIIAFYLILFFWKRKPYLAFVVFANLSLILADRLFFEKPHLLSLRFLVFSILIFGLTFIFNLYLTKRPIVIYEEKILVQKRVLSIPIEDFLYGFNFLFLAVILYELFRGS
ncbi:MAG: lycopene cyclase domain-containing protein [Patescibacteria group bacterium]|nr:lycopene cyclase domain-containing protein [Patescibacteria group bacterium]